MTYGLSDKSTMDLAFQWLYNQVPRNGDMESILVDFVEKRHTDASHLLAHIPGDHSLYGNACNEQNNRSIISHHNPGVAKGENTYCEHLVTLIKVLLQLQKECVATTNQLLKGMCQKIWVEIGRLKNDPQTCLVQDLRKASTMLCLPIYECYKLAAERAVNHLIHEEVFDEQNQQQFILLDHQGLMMLHAKSSLRSMIDVHVKSDSKNLTCVHMRSR